MILLTSALVAIPILFLAACFWFGNTLGLYSIRLLVKIKYREINQTTPGELQQMLESPIATTLKLVDVRTREEYEVSHLPNAEHLSPDAALSEWETSYRDANGGFILYCAVGYRASQVARRLIRNGMTNISILDGSIFEWANQGRPLQCGGDCTKLVHPYHSSSSRLLKPEHRAPLPPS